METRTFWLSFADPDRPKGQQFLGVVIVDVTQADADEWIDAVGWMFPFRREGSEWEGAASRKCHTLGINPGGAMLSSPITGPSPVPLIKDRLLSRDELLAAGLIEADEVPKPYVAYGDDVEEDRER